MPSLQKTTKNNDIFRGFLYYWSYFFALLSPYMKGFINYVRISVKSKNGVIFRQWANKILKDYMLKGYAINQRRLEYLEKTTDIRTLF